MTSIHKIYSVALILSTLTIAACSEPKEPVTQEPQKETTADIVSTAAPAGDATLRVKKSEDGADTAFMARTAEKTTTATVEAINHETREVTLKREDSSIFSVTARKDTANFEQVSVGDTVNTKHVKQVLITLIEGGNIPPSSTVIDNAIQAEEGEMPLRAEIEVLIDTYTIEDINIEENTFKLMNVDGLVEEYTARNPKNLERASVGDSVIVKVTNAFAVEALKASER